MYFYYAKIDCTIFIKVGPIASYLYCLLLHLFLTTKRHPSDVEPSYIPIFRLIQSAVYPVGRSTDQSLLTRIIVYIYKDLGRIFTQNLVLILTFGCPTCLPNFSLIEASVSELEQFLCLCEKNKNNKKKKKTKKKLKLWSLVSQK